ncbi:MAG TPA: ABC transporter ATP-binding protein [Gemmatimonadales bacterium]|nr:ABC transporter ATP-binding protein [Gemmatimonadales bacterium]
MLDVHLLRRRGPFALDAAFQSPVGTTTVLVGESGAGKTTALRLLAGLERLDGGFVTLGAHRYGDAAAGVHRPAWRRDIGYVAQDYALFPHLSVFENVAFGLRAAGLRRPTVDRRVAEALSLLGIEDLARRASQGISGGQQQRVALARALVLGPALLLLDEPLSALDLQTRRSVRGELRALLQRLPCVTIYVTHSPVEALVFGDQIVVLEAGRVAQAGTRDALLRYPRSPFVAELVGTNLFVGRVRHGGQLLAPGIRTAEGLFELTDAPGADTAYLTVSPREITLSRHLPDGSAQNVVLGTVRELIPEPPAGERVRVVVDARPTLVVEVTREAVASLGLAEGERVHAAFKATGVRVYR